MSLFLLEREANTSALPTLSTIFVAKQTIRKQRQGDATGQTGH